MKIFSETNVYEASLERIRYLFDEFPEVIVNHSGGKDSTTIFHLAMKIAKEKGRLPLKVCFIDQEAEWQGTIDHIEKVMNHKDVEPLWYQMPLRLFNSTSTIDPWLYCWEEGKEWIREKSDISIKQNDYGTDTFKDLFDSIIKRDYKGKKCCRLTGVRTEESPARAIGLTYNKTYKWITWGKKVTEGFHYNFCPIYDWSYTDVWKFIEDNGFEYNKIYDYMYRYGVPINKMRVSNVHHETSFHHLYTLQELEPETWEKISERISGVNTAGQLQENGFRIKPKQLPTMFDNWKEYRDYLLENIITDVKYKEIYRKKFEQMDKKFYGYMNMNKLYLAEINTMMANDYHFTKLENFGIGGDNITIAKMKKEEVLNGQHA